MSSPSPSPSLSASPSPSPSLSPDSPSTAAADALAGFTAVFVKAWSSWPLNLELEAGQSLRWEFKTQAHDLQFAAHFHPQPLQAAAGAGASASSSGHHHKHGKHAPIVVSELTRLPRVDQILHSGCFSAPSPGTLTLLFDNSYSKLRGKNLLVRTTLLSTTQLASRSVVFGETRLTPLGAATIEGFRETDEMFVVALPFGPAFLHASFVTSCPVEEPARSINDRCRVGVDLFFNNRIWESEAFFQRDIEVYPVFSLAYGSLGFLRALMTWDKGDIAQANHRLKQTRTLVSALLPQESALKSVGRFLARSQSAVLTPLQLEHTLIQAEAYLLQALLLFTEESYLSVVKAGLRIRSAWKLYELCDQTIKAYPPEVRASLDPSVKGGIEYGLGNFNVIISILPSIILRVVSALGFPSDRTKGLELLNSCAASGGIRQPLSWLTLLFVQVIIPSFFTVRPAYHIAEGQRVLTDAFAKYPDGALFLWMQGRLNRMQRDLPRAIASFTRSAAGQPGWLQLQHLCLYELGFCHFFLRDWTRSLGCWERLAQENSWSKAFFIYMQAVCTLALSCGNGKDDSSSSSCSDGESKQQQYLSEAARLFAQVDPAITRKFGGKIISIEQFVSRRAGQFLAASSSTSSAASSSAAAPAPLVVAHPLLPALELIYLFYGLIQMSDAGLESVLATIDSILAPGDLAEDESRFLALLLRAATLKGLRRWNAAKLVLASIDSGLHGSGAVSLAPESYIAAFARFESGSLIMEQVVEKDALIAEADAAGREAEPASIDQQSGGVSASAPASASASAAVPWSASRLLALDAAHALLKKAEGMKACYQFANRLHLRIHLACVEITMMRNGWDEIRGNVQSDSDLAPSAQRTKEEERALQGDSDEEKEE